MADRKMAQSKPNFWKDNPERVMIVLFPLITLSLFIVAAVLWWVFQNDMLHLR